jgi:hypothetical protein
MRTVGICELRMLLSWELTGCETAGTADADRAFDAEATVCSAVRLLRYRTGWRGVVRNTCRCPDPHLHASLKTSELQAESGGRATGMVHNMLDLHTT